MFSLEDAIFKMDCKTGQSFTVKVNIFMLLEYLCAMHIYITPQILVYAQFSQFIPVESFLLISYKSYRKMHKVEGHDVSLFRYIFRRTEFFCCCSFPSECFCRLNIYV